MKEGHIQITPEQASAESEDRFHRFKLISWWDQSRLSSANVVVIGAGALGNELIKNLALLGVGNVFVADMDRIENSNLSRSVLYRAKDNGQSKAATAAAAARDIYPDIKSQAFHGNVVYDLGLGVFRWADVVLGGLDNREARLAINRACWKVGKPFVDGAIEQIQGMVRVFDPASDGPCYECTMSEMDWKLLQMRRSCNLLTHDEMTAGKTPTTPTISAIIAGVQAQETVKLLHGMQTIRGQGWIFNGLSTEAYTVEYQRKDDCHSHDVPEEIITLDRGVADITVSEQLAEARKLLGRRARLELAREMLEKLVCPRCGKSEELFASLGRVAASKASCPHCPGVKREVHTFFEIKGDESFADRTLAEIGVPPFDIVFGRHDDRLIGFELSGDAPAVLGPVLQTQEQIEWL